MPSHISPYGRTSRRSGVLTAKVIRPATSATNQQFTCVIKNHVSGSISSDDVIYLTTLSSI